MAGEGESVEIITETISQKDETDISHVKNSDENEMINLEKESISEKVVSDKIPAIENGFHDETEPNEVKDNEDTLEQNSSTQDQNQTEPSETCESKSPNSNERLMKLPLSRIKVIMKTDPDVTLASQEAVVALCKATELFIGAISKDAVVTTLSSKRKTLQRKDLDVVLDSRDGYAFLEGTLD
ncbi:DNA polymerase epsilon subunit 4-like [Mytilus californianus]|uniref:DNA polymerase epsilon subunit 4-like n=1 Tax=Mytilus californianus TaxID=6549 RepID=UPI002248490F|nr:DNA polymerase epsilon subunit 4-like [Mytilus californianus]